MGLGEKVATLMSIHKHVQVLSLHYHYMYSCKFNSWSIIVGLGGVLSCHCNGYNAVIMVSGMISCATVINVDVTDDERQSERRQCHIWQASLHVLMGQIFSSSPL